MSNVVVVVCSAGQMRVEGICKSENLLWHGKITSEEALQNLLKSFLPLKGVWRVVMKKNAEATARRGSVVCCILLIDMLGNGYGIQAQNHVALLLGNKMPQGFTLGILY